METLLKKMKKYAAEKHSNQMYDENPYFKHLQDVHDVLIEFGYTFEKYPELIIASFAHDILEDTATSYSDLKKEFGEEIAEIVFCMTDEQGRTRKEKKDKTYPKLAGNQDSIILKLCDRIANVRHSKNSGKGGFSDMYLKEYKDFRWRLHKPGHCDALWEELDSLMVVQDV